MKSVHKIMCLPVVLAFCAAGASALTPKVGFAVGYNMLKMGTTITNDNDNENESESENTVDVSRFIDAFGVSATIDASLALNTETSDKPWTLFGNLELAFPSQINVTDSATAGGQTEKVEGTTPISAGHNFGFQVGIGQTYFNKHRVNAFCGFGILYRNVAFSVDDDIKSDIEGYVMDVPSEITGSFFGFSMLVKIDAFFTEKIGMYLAADGGIGAGSSTLTKTKLEDSTGAVFFFNPRIGAVYRF